MKVKKYLIIISILITIISCNKKEEITVGFLYSSKVTDRFVRESEYFEERAKQLGATVIIEQANNDDALQIEKAIELFDKGVDGLAVIPVNSNTASTIVREGKSRGIPVIAYNRLINNCDLDLFISGDNENIGEIVCSEVLKRKPKGNYVILGGDKFDRNGLELHEAILSRLKPHQESGDINIVYETYIEEWNSEIAAFELEQVISFYGKDIDVVMAGYDGMADAVIQVLKKYDMQGKVIVTGQDAELKGCKNILHNYQHVTVFHPLKQLAYTAAEATVKIIKGQGIASMVTHKVNNGFKDVPAIKIKSLKVTKDNLDEVLVKSGFYTKEQLYN